MMADVAASANDPIFLNHHAMVDCIFERWLQENPNAQYPVSSKIPKGHRQENYIVPFFPLYKHGDMFHTAEKFGYRCTIQSQNKSQNKSLPKWAIGLIALAALVFVVLVIVIIVCCIIKFCFRKGKSTYEHIEGDDNPTALSQHPRS